MTPVDQEILHEPENGRIGDCQRAVLAALMGIPSKDIPHFAQIAHEVGGNDDVFWGEIQSWLGQFGLAYLTAPASSIQGFFELKGDLYHEISGPSPRCTDYWHAAVGVSGRLVYDPHPSKSGLEGPQEDWQHGYLVVRDIEKLRSAMGQVPSATVSSTTPMTEPPSTRVTVSFNHDPIYRYAADKGLDYNELCTVLGKAVDIRDQALDEGDIGLAGMRNEDRVNAQARAEKLEGTLKALLEVAATWEPEYATALDKRVLKMAQEDLTS